MKALSRVLGGIALSVCLLLSSCVVLPYVAVKSIPPPHISKPHVTVAYAQPKMSPDGTTSYFIKIVSQETTAMTQRSDFLRMWWVEAAYPVWSKFFLCRADVAGVNPEALFELPAERFTWQGDIQSGVRHRVKWPAIVSSDVSWSKMK